MDLTEKQYEKFSSWMKSKGVSNTCPTCRQPKMGAGSVVGLSQYDLEKRVLNVGATMPVIIAKCENCGFVQMFSAQSCGLL